MKFITDAYDLHHLKELKEAGADAVVLADPFYSARGAAPVKTEDFPLYKKECSAVGLECFALVNRLFTEDELDGLWEHLQFLKNLDIDGIYFGDEAVLRFAQQLGMEDRLRYQPDTLITNAMDVRFYLQERIQSVVLSGEITLAEICFIASQCRGDQLETVIHGRLNMMHSKRHLISSYLKFIHRDVDIRNKRTLYMMEETRDEHMPIMEDDLGTHAFSGFTLVSFLEIRQLAKAGIGNVRIHGIFHDVDYVKEALGCYRRILDGAVDAEQMLRDYEQNHMDDHITNGFYYKKTSMVK